MSNKEVDDRELEDVNGGALDLQQTTGNPEHSGTLDSKDSPEDVSSGAGGPGGPGVSDINDV